MQKLDKAFVGLVLLIGGAVTFAAVSALHANRNKVGEQRMDKLYAWNQFVRESPLDEPTKNRLKRNLGFVGFSDGAKEKVKEGVKEGIKKGWDAFVDGHIALGDRNAAKEFGHAVVDADLVEVAKAFMTPSETAGPDKDNAPNSHPSAGNNNPDGLVGKSVVPGLPPSVGVTVMTPKDQGGKGGGGVGGSKGGGGGVSDHGWTGVDKGSPQVEHASHIS